jgi:hypothetical protein
VCLNDIHYSYSDAVPVDNVTGQREFCSCQEQVLPSRQLVQSDCRAQPASCLVGTGGFSLEGKRSDYKANRASLLPLPCAFMTWC